MCRFKELFHLSLKPRSDSRQGSVLPENEVGVLHTGTEPWLARGSHSGGLEARRTRVIHRDGSLQGPGWLAGSLSTAWPPHADGALTPHWYGG